MSEERGETCRTREEMGRATLRADAARNREHLLTSAAAIFLREGPRFTMQAVAQEAGVGAGTLYRHFPDREVLLAALVSRSSTQVIGLARAARACMTDPLQAIRGFLFGVIEHRHVLVLPFTGAPPTALNAEVGARQTIREELGLVVQAGQDAGSIRADVNALDVMIAAARLAQRLPHLPDDPRADRRQAEIFVDGLRATPASGSGWALTPHDLDHDGPTKPP